MKYWDATNVTVETVVVIHVMVVYLDKWPEAPHECRKRLRIRLVLWAEKSVWWRLRGFYRIW